MNPGLIRLRTEHYENENLHYPKKMGRPSLLVIILLGCLLQPLPTVCCHSGGCHHWFLELGLSQDLLQCLIFVASPPRDLPVAASHVENFLTTAGTAHTQHHTQAARPSQEMKLPPRNHDYFKDKYSYCDSDNLENFTTDYFEYEQGQKPIIVKDRLKQNVDFWKALGAGNLILDTILNGYKIPFFSTPSKVILHNNMSAKQHPDFVHQAINDLLARGLIEKCEIPPSVVNPLTVSIQSNGKKRLVLDLRHINRHIWKQSIKYDDLKIVLEYLEAGSYMFKFDIHSAYHFISIFPPHTEYLGFSWVNEKRENVFYKFLVLPFGITSAPYIFVKVTRPLIAKWRGEGKKVLMFLDDGFGCADDFHMCHAAD